MDQQSTIQSQFSALRWVSEQPTRALLTRAQPPEGLARECLWKASSRTL
jgi:hypothetical protein